MMQQPVSGGLDVSSPITFPEDTEDPRVAVDDSAPGGLWGFIKVQDTCMQCKARTAHSCARVRPDALVL